MSSAGNGMGPPHWPDPDPDHVLTSRQQRILQAIADFAQRRGYAPTMREIGEAAGLTSTSSVSYRLSVLQRRGYLRRDPGRPRAIELRLPGQPTVLLEVEDLVPRPLTFAPFRRCGCAPVIPEAPGGSRSARHDCSWRALATVRMLVNPEVAGGSQSRIAADGGV
jgi:LexA DNA binding domain